MVYIDTMVSLPSCPIDVIAQLDHCVNARETMSAGLQKHTEYTLVVYITKVTTDLRLPPGNITTICMFSLENAITHFPKVSLHMATPQVM